MPEIKLEDPGNACSGPMEAEIRRRLCNLPRLNPAATRLLALSASAHAELEDYEGIFASDPSLTAELLLLANSAEFAIRGSATNIRFALILLGTERLRSFAVSLAMGRYARFAGARGRLIWEHSMATAVISEELGGLAGTASPYLYTAGLTHDLGRLGLLLTDGRQYSEAIDRVFRDREEALSVERLSFGVTHCQTGEFLARTWRFPELLCRVIRLHHDPPGTSDDRLLHTIRAGCILAAKLGYPEVALEEPEPLAPEFDDLPEAGLQALAEAVEKRLKLCAAPLA